MNWKMGLSFPSISRNLLKWLPVEKTCSCRCSGCQYWRFLIVGYANELALHTTFEQGMATWSSSRNELWIKGKTSGDYLEIVEVRVIVK